MSSLQTSWGKLQAQKSPQGLRRAGFQDFIGSWRSLNKSRKHLNLNYFNVFNFHLCT